ncbi:MAG: hypothetical protein VB144_12550 [Clostridia bacterium]|nr:hypothetical protein [Clostridia bacterium]
MPVPSQNVLERFRGFSLFYCGKWAKAGFAKFTEIALNIVNNIDRLGGSVRMWESGKTAYWFNDVIVIVFNGKLQTVIPGSLEYFRGMK